MDWLNFILSVIEAIAWPVAFVAAVVFLRQEWVDVIQSRHKASFYTLTRFFWYFGFKR